MSKRMTLLLIGVAAVSSVLSCYIKEQTKKRKMSLAIGSDQGGVVHLSAISLEQMISQLLNDYKNVTPLGIRVHFTQGNVLEVTGTLLLKQGRLSRPSLKEVEEHLQQKLREWTGLVLPASALKLESNLN